MAAVRKVAAAVRGCRGMGGLGWPAWAGESEDPPVQTEAGLGASIMTAGGARRVMGGVSPPCREGSP